jgi:quercetin dioxygenase-like cupin family protein
MKRFFIGMVMGLLAFALQAQSPAGERIVPAQLVVENAKVKVVRWSLQPGERSPVHTHSLDHIYIVVHGSKIRDHVVKNGTVHDDDQETGRAAFSKAVGKTHWFENVGTTPYEMISIDLKEIAK